MRPLTPMPRISRARSRPAGAAAAAIGAAGAANVRAPCHIRYRPPATVSPVRTPGVRATRVPTPAATTLVIAA